VNICLGSLNVALVSEEFPPFMFGGISTVCYDLAHSLSQKGIETTVFCGRSNRPAIERVNDYLEIVRLPCLNIPPRFLWFQLQNLFNLTKQLKDRTLIHAVNPQVSPICIYLKKKLTKPLVTSYHGVPAYDLEAFINSPTSLWALGDFAYQVLEYPLNDSFSRISLVKSDHVVSCSHTTLNELRSIYGMPNPENSSVIYNGINFERIEKIQSDFRARAYGRDDGNLTLIYNGRLYWHKGITYLIKAFELLIHDFPNVKLKVFGTGPLGKKVQALVSTSGLREKVFILGYVESHDQLLNEVMKADIAVFPSLREAQPMSALEAMAFGKPVVVFDLPFSREYVKNHYNGLLAVPKDPKDLADKIGILISDEGLCHRLGQNAYIYVKQHHNWASLVDKYVEIYSRVTNNC
jgi:glycosyltransferase involved in cell wall biosynthesis